MNIQMNNRASKIPNDIQNRNSEAWKKLCEYIDIIAKKRFHSKRVFR